MKKIKSVAVHATGLRIPGHMAVLKNGRLLVSEFGGGVVRDITNPDDYGKSTKGIYASNLEHPSGLLELSDGRILVADSGRGGLFDITKSKTIVDEKKYIMTGISHAYSIVEFNGNIYSSYSNNREVGMAKIAEGKKFSKENHTHVYGFPVVLTLEPYPKMLGCGGSWGTTGGGGQLFLAHKALGCIFDVTNGGSFDELRENRFAWGINSPLGMIMDPNEEFLYITEQGNGVIKMIDKKGGYSRFATPFLSGFTEPSCIRFTPDYQFAYICDKGTGSVYKIEFE